MITEDQYQTLIALEQNGMITTADKNLRSKIDSLLRSLENLSQKKLRIEYEIQKQKKSLYRKREELKKKSSSTQKKIKIAIESNILDILDEQLDSDCEELRRIDSILLQESSQKLE